MQVNHIQPEQKQINNRKKVVNASVAGSAIGIATTVAGIYKMAKKGNPSLSLRKLAYNEKDVLLIGTNAVLGGLAGGLIADKDKENVVPKLRETTHQLIGNTLFPVSFVALGNKILEKTNFKLPQINSNSKIANVANVFLKALPKSAMTLLGLFGGAAIGNKIVNSINNKIFKEEVKHSVAPEDMLVHTDDICFATSMLLKDSPKISSFTNAILPATFLVSGAKTGMQQREV